MARPPPCVVFIARTHWVVGGVILASIALLYWLTHRLPRIEFGLQTYLIAGGLAVLYLATGALVWFGRQPGPALSRVCALLYLPRPRFGFSIWKMMDSPEFRAHFERTARTTPG